MKQQNQIIKGEVDFKPYCEKNGLLPIDSFMIYGETTGVEDTAEIIPGTEKLVEEIYNYNFSAALEILRKLWI